MKHLIMTIFMTVVLSSAGMYANDLPDENETIVNTTKEIIRNMTKLRFGEVLKFFYPGSELAKEAEKLLVEFESDKEDPSFIEFKESTFSHINKVFDFGSDKGIIVCKTNKNGKKEIA
ncbi:MAG TPA: hypothetical protein PKM07_09655, partial [Spirochaetota bacterium]|nr:hypothetical protein [Spirochaetota bacterium]HPY03419.1 hypothetical protein [Spirochaetota bacterium]